MGEKVTEIDVRENGMSMFPIAMSVKASDGEVHSAMQQVEEYDNLRISEKFIARERRFSRSGMESVARSVCELGGTGGESDECSFGLQIFPRECRCGVA